MKNKAVFLDRDGVVNLERGTYNCTTDDFVINGDVGEAIQLLKENNFQVIIISNQAGIAKKLFTHEMVEAMHRKLLDYLAGFGTTVDEFYYCPHHETFTNCLCRKPKSLMIEKALARFNIDPKESWLIGDSIRDIEAAIAAGVKGIHIEPNSALLPVSQNYRNLKATMKAKHIMLNGAFLPAENPCIMPGNRGMLYGEVVWQTMRGASSKVFFFDAYFEHLCDEMNMKGIPLPALFSSKIVEHDIFLLLQKCRIYRGSLVRITVFRNENDSFFYQADSPVSVLIEAENHPDQHYLLNETGLRMAAFEDILYPSVKPVFTASYQALGFTGIEKYIRLLNANNVFLVNDEGNIFQAPDANVMFIKDNDLFIPSERYLYSTDVLCGYVENAAEKIGLSVSRDSEIQPRDLLNFDEVLLIDSIHGIRWVQAFGEKRFYNRVATKLTSALCDLA